MKPVVSVIMATYNCEVYIEQAIRSVLDQTWGNLEIVVVDDGSIDETQTVLERLSEADHRIRIVSQNNSGRPSIARNAGLYNALGRYICFLDADDFYEPNRIEILMQGFISHPDWIAVFHDIQLLEQDGKTFIRTYLSDADFFALASSWLVDLGNSWYECNAEFYHFMSLRYAAIHTASVLIDTEKFPRNQLVFNEQFSICEDTDLWIRLGMTGKLGFYKDTLSNYRQHPASITKNQKLYLEETAKFHEYNFMRTQPKFSIAEQNAYRHKISKCWFYLGCHLFSQRIDLAQARAALIRSLGWHVDVDTVFVLFKTFVPAFVISWLKSL